MHSSKPLLFVVLCVAVVAMPHPPAAAGTPPGGPSGPKDGAPAPAFEHVPGKSKGPKAFPVADPAKAVPVSPCVRAAYDKFTADAKAIVAAGGVGVDAALRARKQALVSHEALKAAGCKGVD